MLYISCNPPPQHLPDADVVRLALDQYDHIVTLGQRAGRLLTLSEVGIEDKIKETERLIELVRLGIVNFPKEVVIPSIGYYCLIGREEDDSSQLRQPPVIFDYYKHLSNAQIALGKTTKILEDLN